MSRALTTDAYLAGLPDDQRQALTQLRETITSAVPGAEEAIRTGVPAIRYKGKTVVGFGAAKRHVALYVMYGAALSDLGAGLKAFDVSRTVIRFTPDQPLPPSLVERIVASRLAEIDGAGA